MDINSEVKDGTAEVWLWGVAPGKRLLLVEREFRPYMYVVPSRSADLKKLGDEALRACERLEEKGTVEASERSYFGRRVSAVKAQFTNPEKAETLARTLKKLSGVEEVLEDDIRLANRYLVDCGIKPCCWHRWRVRSFEKPSGVDVDAAYEVLGKPSAKERAEVPALRAMAFHALYFGRKGSPRPDRDPIAVISVSTSDGKVRQFVADNGNDEKALEAFVRFVRRHDPDIIVGFGSNRRDWPYLIERAKRLGMSLAVARSGAEPHGSVYGHISVTGRANVDLHDFASEVPELQLGNLEEMAEYLEVRQAKDFTRIKETDFAAHWQNPARRRDLLRFCEERAEATLRCCEEVLDYLAQLSNLTGLPLDHVATAAVGFRVESYLISQAERFGALIPSRVQRPYIPYAGGIVLRPKPGIHRDVAVLDFRSMYPNLMILYNISPDTYVPPKSKVSLRDVHVAPEVGHRFMKEPAGLYRFALQNLIDARREIQSELEKTSAGSVKYKVLDARQRAVKIVANAMYGYAGWIGARWYSKAVAEATAAWGRDVITRSLNLARKMNLEVIYGDTDSLFVENDEKKIKKVVGQIGEKLGLEARPDKVYRSVLFTEAKKKYSGLTSQGQLDIVGLEAVRGDWTEAARSVQRTVVDMVLRGRTREEAERFVLSYISDLRAGKISVEDLVIWKTLSKPVEEYKVNAPHVAAARKLKKEGWDLGSGDIVGYVIVKGSGRLYERAEPYLLTTGDNLDLQYYEENQVWPAVSRILEALAPRRPSGKTQTRLDSASIKEKERHERPGQRMKEYLNDLVSAARRLRSKRPREATVLYHDEADGICSGAIAKKALEREGFAVQLISLEKLYPEVVEKLHSQRNKTFIYVDLGAGQVERICSVNQGRNLAIVLDHHDTKPSKDAEVINLDPELYGISGEKEASASTVAYLFAKALDPVNKDMAHLAIIGSAEIPGPLVGLNEEPLKDALDQGLAEMRGSGERRDVKILAMAKAVSYRRLSTMLSVMGSVGYYRDGTLRAIEACLKGFSAELDRFAVRLEKERKEANAKLLAEIRKRGLRQGKATQWFHARDIFRGMGVKVVGSFSSYLSFQRVVNQKKYLIGFMNMSPQVPGFGTLGKNLVKVSARVPRDLARLVASGEMPAASALLIQGCEKLGGFADGHSVAASGVVPQGREENLIQILEEMLKKP